MDIDEPRPLSGARVRLRPMKDADVRRRTALGRTREIVRGFGGDLASDTAMSEAEARLQLVQRFGLGPHWVIADLDDLLIGMCRLAPIDPQNCSARFAIGILDQRLLGTGLGTEATRLVVQYGFDVLAMHRISLIVLADNARAIAAYSKCGFVEEGRLRETLWRDGEWHDDVCMAIVRPTR